MAIKLLDLIEAIRERLSDFGGDRGAPSAGFYAKWQEDDSTCLWRNSELVRYVRLTIEDIGRRVPIRDRVSRLALSSGRRQYALSDCILTIDSVIRLSDSEPLIRTTLGEIEHVDRFWREGRTYLYEDGRRPELTRRVVDGGREPVSDWRLASGKPTHYFLDERNYYLSVYPLPDADHLDAVEIRYSRTYSTRFGWDDVATESTPTFEIDEVPSAYFRAIIAGVTAQAYLKQDIDTESVARADRAEAEFSALIGPQKTAKQIASDAKWSGRSIRIEPRALYY